MNFSIEESKENDSIIKAATGNIKMRTIQNLLFSQTVQAVRINNQAAPLLGLAKSMYYHVVVSILWLHVEYIHFTVKYIVQESTELRT